MLGKPGGASVIIALKEARKSKQRRDYGEEKKDEAKSTESTVEEWRNKKNAEKPTGDIQDHQQVMETMHEKMTEMMGMLEQMMGMESDENEGD